jgi:hypothetical protein
VRPLSSDIQVILNEIEARAASGAREAFLRGLQHGPIELPEARVVKSLEDWRRAVLARYPERSWKQAVVSLIPSPRFRPSDIYTGRRVELGALREGAKSLNVGTHNALEALIADGVVAKLGDGRYAPADEHGPLPETATDPTQSYRPTSQYDEHLARLVGYAMWTWALLEWNVIYLSDLLRPGAVEVSRDKPREQIAADFAQAVSSIRGRVALDFQSRLGAVAAEFEELVARHRALVFARPCSVEGRNALSYAGVHETLWTSALLMQTAQAFERASNDANALFHNAVLRAQLAALVAHEDDHGLELAAFDNPDIRVVGGAAKIALLRSLSPLIALAGIRANYGALSYAQALGQHGILDAAEATVIARLASDVDRANFGEDPNDLRSKRRVLEEVWRLTHAPSSIQRAVAYRARTAQKAPVVPPRPLPGEDLPHIAILEVEGVTLTVPRHVPSEWGEQEVILDVDGPEGIRFDRGAVAKTSGSRVLGNASAIALVPWLIDEPT